MMRSKRSSGTHWGAGVSTKMTFNPGVKIKYRHHVEKTIQTVHLMKVYLSTPGIRKNDFYGHPNGGDNLEPFRLTYVSRCSVFHTSGIFGNGNNFENILLNNNKSKYLPLVMDFTVDINTDLTWRVEISFLKTLQFHNMLELEH